MSTWFFSEYSFLKATVGKPTRMRKITRGGTMYRDWLIEDELLQQPIIMINLGLKKFAERPEEQQVELLQWIGSSPQEGIRR
jgi:hypothetical protein